MTSDVRMTNALISWNPIRRWHFILVNFISCPGAGDASFALALTEGQAPPYYYYLVRNMTDTLYQGTMPPVGDPPIYLDNIIPGDYILIVEDANGCKKLNSGRYLMHL